MDYSIIVGKKWECLFSYKKTIKMWETSTFYHNIDCWVLKSKHINLVYSMDFAVLFMKIFIRGLFFLNEFKICSQKKIVWVKFATKESLLKNLFKRIKIFSFIFEKMHISHFLQICFLFNFPSKNQSLSSKNCFRGPRISHSISILLCSFFYLLKQIMILLLFNSLVLGISQLNLIEFL